MRTKINSGSQTAIITRFHNMGETVKNNANRDAKCIFVYFQKTCWYFFYTLQFNFFSHTFGAARLR